MMCVLLTYLLVWGTDTVWTSSVAHKSRVCWCSQHYAVKQIKFTEGQW